MDNNTTKKTTTKAKAPIGVHKKLNAIMGEIGALKKDKKNEHFKYSYLSEEAIKKAVQPLLVKYGINFQIDIKEVTQEGNRTTILTHYTFTDSETGETVEGDFAGQGVDNQDKGIWKALTGALKYILSSSFLIPTGDDVEAHNTSAKAATPAKPAVAPDAPAKPEETSGTAKLINETQRKRLFVLMKELGKDDAWFKGWMKSSVNKESRNDLTFAEAASFIKKMDDKLKENKKAEEVEFGTCEHCGAKEGEDHQEGCELAATQMPE